MTTRSRVSTGTSSTFDPLDDDFFNTRDPPPQEDEELEMAARDPVLERKMSPTVRARRRRLTRLAKGVVGCAALILLAAGVMRLAPSLPKASAAIAAPGTTADTPRVAHRGAGKDPGSIRK